MPALKRIAIGERIGTRVAIANALIGKNYFVQSVCDCGHTQTIAESSFIKSTCGKCGMKGGPARKYGDRLIYGNRLYHNWVAMRRRCRSVGEAHSKHWGDRGISVCAEWLSDFAAFERWALSNGYLPGLSIDRINSNGDYTPENCEWVTRQENSRRMRAEYVLVKRQSFPISSLLSFGS